MIKICENIWDEGEYSYAAAYGFVPNIHGYLHDDGENRDCMIIAPGGGYCVCAPHEGELVALEFYNRGMNTFVLTYSTDITVSVPLKLQPLNDISRAVRFVRKRSLEYKIGGKKLIVCGFSASGHLCASLITHYAEVKDPSSEYDVISNRPDGAILSYPVITSGEYAHRGSFDALLGKEPGEEELEYFSLEKQVKTDTPPCFLWQTQTDELVPVENSYLFALALREKGVPFAHYVFPTGVHGIGIVSDLNDETGTYTMEQVDRAVKAVGEGKGVNVSEARMKELAEQFSDDNEEKGGIEQDKNYPPLIEDAGLWLDLAKVWMDRL
ncbi:MAG: alpha/beta hydrolase [Lachnospiraceae bacterium]|nr:alpha/beta hydrolase [Lachnospiraceae bacterium]